MRTMALKAVIPVACVAFLMSACSAAQPNMPEKNLEIKSVPRSVVHEGNLNRISVIPSYNGPKQQTTNRHGTTFSGMGTSTYSRIGSSGLSAEGQSGELEAMLNKQGIQGVKILMIKDKVVIGAKQGGASGIDPLQSKLLSPYAGSAGTSNKNSSGSTAVHSNKEQDHFLEQARLRVEALIGGRAHVLTVTHPAALAAMERAKGKSLKTSSTKAQSKDIALILKHAKASK